MDRLSPDILPTLGMEGHVLDRERAHLKVLLCSTTCLECTCRLRKDSTGIGIILKNFKVSKKMQNFFLAAKSIVQKKNFKLLLND